MEDFEDEIYCEPDSMNPLCDVWTFKGANQWYYTREEAEEAYNKLPSFKISRKHKGKVTKEMIDKAMEEMIEEYHQSDRKRH